MQLTLRRDRSEAFASVRRHAAVLLDRSVDLGLLCVIFLAPLFMGGRHPLGRLVYVALVGLVTVAWLGGQCLAARASLRRSGTEWLWLAACCVLLVQLAPISPSALQRISPEISNLLPLWSNSGDAPSFGRWERLSLTPAATRGGLTILIAHAAWFFVLVQRMSRVDDVQRLFRWVALAGLVMAVIALTQYLLGNGKFMWVYQNPFRDTRTVVRGPFFNENHLAHFLALSIAPLMIWLQTAPLTAKLGESAWRHARRVTFTRFLLGLGVGLIAFATLLTRSRGGMLMLLLASGITIARLFVIGQLRRRAALGLAAVGVVLMIALALHGYDQVQLQMASLTSGSIDQLDEHGGRRHLWSAALSIFRHFPLLGTGVGSYREVYPRYLSEHTLYDYTYAESGYLQVLTETGVIGGVLLLLAIGLVARWCLRLHSRTALDPRIATLTIATLAALGVSLSHSLCDFVWYLPACMTVTLVLAAGCCRLAALIRPPENDQDGCVVFVPRIGWCAAMAIAILLTWTSLCQLVPPAMASKHWDAYLIESREALVDSQRQPLEASASDESDWQSSMQTARSLRHHLRAAIACDPNNGRSHLRLATICLRIFEQSQQRAENAMSLAQIRDAALASRFPTRKAQDLWLSAAVGSNRRFLDEAMQHADRALRLCPLQGEAYLHLAELMFLQSPRSPLHQQLVAQALHVRPYSAGVQFAAGREAALQGRLDEMMRLWREAFHREESLKQSIIQLLAPQLQADQFIEQFQPDLADLLQLHAFYQQTLSTAQATATARAYLDQLDQSAANATARDWQAGYTLAAGIGARDQAIACARESIERDADNYTMRRRFALELLSQGYASEAVSNLQWCVRRRPYDADAQAKLQWAQKLLNEGNVKRASYTDESASH